MTRGVVGVGPIASATAGFTRPVRHILGRDERVGLRVVAVLVDQPQVEDLHRPVRVQAREDLRDRAEVSVDELAQAAVVVDGAGPGTAGDEQLEVRDAEGVLDVDGEHAEPELVLGRRLKAVLGRRPALRARCSYGTRHTSPTESGSK